MNRHAWLLVLLTATSAEAASTFETYGPLASQVDRFGAQRIVDVADDGRVCMTVPVAGTYWPAVWDVSEVTVFGATASFVRGAAFGIAADGSRVAGWAQDGSGTAASVWTGGVFQRLGVATNTRINVVTGISSDGLIAGGFSNPGHAYRYVATGDLFEPLAPAMDWSYAKVFDVSDDGAILAGSTSQTGTLVRASVWRNGSPVGTALPWVDGGTGQSEAFGLSRNGRFAAGYSWNETAQQEAVLWDLDTDSLTRMGRWPDGSGGQTGYTIGLDGTDDGSVAVGYGGPWGAGYPIRAFLWRAGVGLRPLDESLACEFGLDLGEWECELATALSSDGRWVAGVAKNTTGDRVAFRAYLDPADYHPCGITAAPLAPAAPSLALSAAPNPFQSSSSVRFDLAESGPVDVAVIDVAGRLVRDLGTRERRAGSNSVLWDGRGGDGHPVPPGVYFVRVNIGNRKESLRLVRVR